MSKVPVQALSSAILILGLVGGARSQDSTDRPLGDVAREQRELRKQPKPEKVYGNKVYGNKDVTPATSPDNSDSCSSQTAEGRAQKRRVQK
jgi:hypothetical protein